MRFIDETVLKLDENEPEALNDELFSLVWLRDILVKLSAALKGIEGNHQNEQYDSGRLEMKLIGLISLHN